VMFVGLNHDTLMNLRSRRRYERSVLGDDHLALRPGAGALTEDQARARSFSNIGFLKQSGGIHSKKLLRSISTSQISNLPNYNLRGFDALFAASGSLQVVEINTNFIRRRSYKMSSNPNSHINKNPALQRYYHSFESRIGYKLFLRDTRHFGYYVPGTYWPFPIDGALRAMEDHLFRSLKLKTGAEVLDAGCGVGHVAIRFAQKGLHVQGIDVVDHHIQKAQRSKYISNISPTKTSDIEHGKWVLLIRNNDNIGFGATFLMWLCLKKRVADIDIL
jgi:hypothetical protein